MRGASSRRQDHMVLGGMMKALDRKLVDHVRRGAVVDLAGTGPVDDVAMSGWGRSRTISASVIRDIVRGHLAADADPRGLQLRGAHIEGRIDLDNINSGVLINLTDCLISGGIAAKDATLPGLYLTGCRLTHPILPALDAWDFTPDVGHGGYAAWVSVAGVVVRLFS